MKNLSHFDIVEKVQSFQTGGWENAKKGVYQIKDTFINFWFKFVFPHMSDLYLLKPYEFYDRYIAPEPGLERQETLILLPRAQTAEILWDYVTGISHS